MPALAGVDVPSLGNTSHGNRNCLTVAQEGKGPQVSIIPWFHDVSWDAIHSEYHSISGHVHLQRVAQWRSVVGVGYSKIGVPERKVQVDDLDISLFAQC